MAVSSASRLTMAVLLVSSVSATVFIRSTAQWSETYPLNYVIDDSGNIVRGWPGFDRAELSKAIQALEGTEVMRFVTMLQKFNRAVNQYVICGPNRARQFSNLTLKT
jgi:hypothetical protein